ncbi:tetratricopeptide repeat protein [Candidatus Uabimicrobium helgolandensis]
MDKISEELSTFNEAKIFEQDGDYNAGSEIYQHLVTLEKIKDDADYSIILDYLNRAGYCYQKSNDMRSAQKCFDEAQKIKQENPILGKEISANLDYNPGLYESLSDFDKSFVNKNELELIDLVSPLQAKAQNFHEKKKPNLAAAHYAKLAELLKRIRPINAESLAKYTEQAAFNFQNAKCYRQALYYYSEAVRLNIQQKKYNSIAMNYNNMSYLYMQYQNFGAALKYCQQSLKFNKKVNNTYQISLNLSNLGQIYRKQKCYEQALNSFEQAVALKINLGKRKDIAHEMYHIAAVYRDQQQYKEAIAKINNALSLVSDIETRKIAIYNDFLGDVYAKQKLPETAIQYLSKALDTYAIHNKPKACEVLAKLCTIYQTQNNQEKLIDSLQQNLQLNIELQNDSEIDRLYREIAIALYSQGKIEEAVEYFTNIVSLREKKGRAKSFSLYYQDLHLLAHWHQEIEEYNEVYSYLQKALNTAQKIDNGYVEETLHRIGDVYFIQKNYTHALKMYEQALQETQQWYMKGLHSIAIADVHVRLKNTELAFKHYDIAQQIHIKERQTQSILFLGTLKDEEQRCVEFKSYYLQTYIDAKIANVYSEDNSDAIQFYLRAINLLKDICAIDAKDIYENQCQNSKLSIDITIDKKRHLIEQINQLTTTCQLLIEKKETSTIIEAAKQLFDTNDSIYGIEYCSELLELCCDILPPRELGSYLSQTGLRYYQLQEYEKSIVFYTKALDIFKDIDNEKINYGLSKVKLILDKSSLVFTSEVINSLEKCVDITRDTDIDIDNEIFHALLMALCLFYKDSETPEKGAYCVEIASKELIDKNKDFVIELLQILSNRYAVIGNKNKVLQYQDTISLLQDPKDNISFLEELDCEKLERMAQTFLSLNDYDKALENFSLLLDEYEKKKNPSSIARTYSSLGCTYNFMENIQKALENLHKALTIAREINHYELIGDVLQKINDVYINNKDIDGALNYNLSMLDLDRRYSIVPLITLDLYHISKVYFVKQELAQATFHAEEALQIAQSSKECLAIDIIAILNHLESLYIQTDNSSKLISTYTNLILIYEKNNEQHLVTTYKDLLFKTCQIYYNKVQKMTPVEKSLEQQQDLFNAFIYLARTKSKEGLVESSSYENSVSHLREACQIYQELKNYVSSRNKQAIYEEMIQCQEGLSQSLLALGDYHMNFNSYEDSTFFYKENIQIRIQMQDNRSLIEGFLRLASAHEKQKKIQLALDALLKALEYCQDSSVEQEEMRLLNNISQLYLSLGNEEQAYIYSEKVVNFYKEVAQTAPLHVNEELLLEAKQVTASIKENTQKKDRDFTLSIEGKLPKRD